MFCLLPHFKSPKYGVNLSSDEDFLKEKLTYRRSKSDKRGKVGTSGMRQRRRSCSAIEMSRAMPSSPRRKKKSDSCVCVKYLFLQKKNFFGQQKRQGPRQRFRRSPKKESGSNRTSRHRRSSIHERKQKSRISSKKKEKSSKSQTTLRGMRNGENKKDEKEDIQFQIYLKKVKLEKNDNINTKD